MMAETSNPAVTLARGALHISKRLVLSYVLDWIFIIGIAAVGGGFNQLKHTSKRAFSLQDPSISYPLLGDTVTTAVLIIVSLVAPAAITLILAFLFVPGGGAPRGTSKALIWRRKLWEWNTAWMGLALALASAFMITEGLKDLAGKPRPHAIAACRPNLNLLSQYQVGGLGDSLGPAIPVLVDSGICQETDAHTLRDIFASWPSGHSSFSFAGLLYSTLWVSSKFAVTLPYLKPSVYDQTRHENPTFDPYISAEHTAIVDGRESASTLNREEQRHQKPGPSVTLYPPRNQAAAPPVYLLVLVFVPIGTALFICVSRWFDYHHHGFDIISGALIGIFTSWFSFRWYHLPIRRGSGWSWGARSRDRAFWLGVGRDTYVGAEGWESGKYDSSSRGPVNEIDEVKPTDEEAQIAKVTGPGMASQSEV